MRGLPGEILCFDNNFFSSYIKPFNISNQKNKFQVFFYLKSIVFFVILFKNKNSFFSSFVINNDTSKIVAYK